MKVSVRRWIMLYSSSYLTYSFAFGRSSYLNSARKVVEDIYFCRPATISVYITMLFLSVRRDLSS